MLPREAGLTMVDADIGGDRNRIGAFKVGQEPHSFCEIELASGAANGYFIVDAVEKS